MGLLGTVGAAGLAGCSGSGDDGSGGGGNSGSNDDADSGGSSGGSGSTESSGDGDSDIAWPSSGQELSAWVPFSTGGGYDWYVRNTSELIEETLPNDPTIVVENVTGGTGMNAANRLWNAEPDGSTFLLRIVSSNVIQEIVQPDAAQFSNTEFVNACTIAETKIGFAQNQNIDPITDWETFADTVTSTRVGTPGATNTATIIAIVLGDQTGAWSREDLDFVHYGGTNELMAAMDRGEVDIGTTTASSITGFVEPDGIQQLMSISNQPVSDEDTALTEWETPFDAEEVVAPFALARPYSFPPGTPDSIVETFVTAVEEALQTEEMQQRAEDANRDLTFRGPKATEQIVSDNVELWSQYEDLLSELY